MNPVKRLTSAFLALFMVFSVLGLGALVSFAAPESGQEQRAVITIYDLAENSTQKEFGVGESFAVYTVLNASEIEQGKIAGIRGTQTYTDGVLELSDECDPDSGMITDLAAMFPVLGDRAIANGGSSSKLSFNFADNSKPGRFDTDTSILLVTHYTVRSGGNAQIRTQLSSMISADDDLTKIVYRDEVLIPSFTMSMSFDLPAEPTEPAPTEPEPTEPEPTEPIPSPVSDFEYSKYNNTITITKYIGDDENVVVPDTIEGCPVTLLGRESFRFQTVESVYIPDSVTRISQEAFQSCNFLKSVRIPDAVTEIDIRTFQMCYSLKSVRLPNVTIVNQSAFSYCKRLQTVDAPNVRSIRAFAFGSCSEMVENTALQNATNIREEAFNGCTSLTSIKFAQGLSALNQYAFEGCTSLKSIEFPDSLANIGKHTFQNCTSLESVTIPQNVTEIGEYAFSNCTALTDVKFMGVPQTLGQSIFADCSSLTNVELSDGMTSLGDRMFSGCTSLKTIDLPDSLTTLTGFSDCPALESVTVPENVTIIGGFSNCSSLKYINFPDSVTRVYPYTFTGCESLKYVILPRNLTTIGLKAFGYESINTGNKYSDFVIYGYRGTEAESYSDSNGITFIALDDAPELPTEPAAQTEPTQEPTASPTIEPTQEPTASPTIEPTQEPTTAPTIAPTQEPTTAPTIAPTLEPTTPPTEPPVTEPTTDPSGTDDPMFVISSNTAHSGETVKVEIEIRNNPGITAFKFKVSYPESMLTLTQVEYKELFSNKAKGKNKLTSPFTISWFSGRSVDETENGVVAVLTFKIEESTPNGQYPILLTYDQDNVFNSAFENQMFKVCNGSVAIFGDSIPGDVNGDSAINMKDIVLLQQYLNDWDVIIDPAASDVNADNAINMKDIVLLQQYLNDWDVELKSGGTP